MADLFFSLFFIARANQKIPNLALGRQSRVSLDFYPNSYRILFKKKLVSFSLIYINCLREILQDYGMVVQQSLPLPCRCDEHVRRGLAQWLRSSGGHSDPDPCPSLLDGELCLGWLGWLGSWGLAGRGGPCRK
jgi:hypothetical protein